MYLKPVRRTRHDVNHVDTITTCGLHYSIVAVNRQVVTYQEAVKTGPGGCPSFSELVHNISEELDVKETPFTLEKDPVRISS